MGRRPLLKTTWATRGCGLKVNIHLVASPPGDSYLVVLTEPASLVAVVMMVAVVEVVVAVVEIVAVLWWQW